MALEAGVVVGVTDVGDKGDSPCMVPVGLIEHAVSAGHDRRVPPGL